MKNLKSFYKKNIVMTIAIIAAIITSLIIVPDNSYKNYLDYKTLATLFSMLVIVTALEKIHFFKLLSEKIITKFGSLRSVALVLIYITFLGSMIIANDMALITFLPLGFYVLNSTNQKKYMAFIFIMQNIAANLGGMLTPFGNPQNLYLYNYFNIPVSEFTSIMLAPFVVSVFLITLSCLFLPKTKLKIEIKLDEKLDKTKSILYFVLFGIFLLVILNVINYLIGMAIVFLAILFIDKQVLKKVDYPLLITFASFFIFAGNVSRIPIVIGFFTNLLNKNTLLTGVLSCQFISNVPSAILLSKFTANYADLLLAVNIGGTGTLVASLASLITYREYVKRNPLKKWYYIKLFLIINFSFLILLTTLALFVF